MKQRVLTGSAILAVLVLMFISRLWTNYVFDICMGIVMIIASLEFSKVLARMGYNNHMTLVGLFPSFLYICLMFGILYKIPLVYIFVIEIGLLALFLALTTLISLFFKDKLKEEMKVRDYKGNYQNFAFKKAINTIIACLYPTLMFSFVILSNRFDELISINGISSFTAGNLGLLVLLATFIIPIITDTFSMLSGMLIKGPKLAPRVSPKKTVAGFVGGVVWSTLMMCVFYFIMNAIDSYSHAFSIENIRMIHFAILGFVGGLVCQCGDLFESFLKRKARVKDSGEFLPGHGGFLDRFDSHIFNAPFVFLFFVFLLI